METIPYFLKLFPIISNLRFFSNKLGRTPSLASAFATQRHLQKSREIVLWLTNQNGSSTFCAKQCVTTWHTQSQCRWKCRLRRRFFSNPSTTPSTPTTGGTRAQGARPRAHQRYRVAAYQPTINSFGPMNSMAVAWSIVRNGTTTPSATKRLVQQRVAVLLARTPRKCCHEQRRSHDYCAQRKLTSAADYGGQSYTSARLLTRGKASWTYGYFEFAPNCRVGSALASDLDARHQRRVAG